MNTELFLLRGSNYVPSSVGLECLMLPVNWFTRAIRSNRARLTAVGQVEIEHVGGRILWILNLSNAENVVSSELLDYLAVEAGLRKLRFLTASVAKHTPLFEVFIQSGYNSSGWYKIWRIKDDITNNNSHEFIWRKTRTSDLFSVNLLQNKWLSNDERRTVPPANKKWPGFVLFCNGVLSGYAYVNTSIGKAMITPVLDPQISNVSSAIKSLINQFFIHIPDHYLVLTASQQWVEVPMQDQIELIQPRHEILLKQLAIRDAVYSSFDLIPNGQHTDIATPISRSKKQDNNTRILRQVIKYKHKNNLFSLKT
ncbi:MAG: hypothetical protein Q7J07_01810 [Pelolinea sp.]|nr:hypothetical protein [Pelolinea sp.]